MQGLPHFILETAVGREKDVQDIDVHGEFEKRVVTLLVMSAFSNFPGASRACADFRDPTAVSRFIGYVLVTYPGRAKNNAMARPAKTNPQKNRDDARLFCALYELEVINPHRPQRLPPGDDPPTQHRP
jgi:hypothetical protein